MSQPGLKPILVPASPGELLDKIAILRIKSERVSDAGKLANIRFELAQLDDVARQYCPASTALANLTAELKTVNEKLWDVENDLRACEQRGDFGAGFVELARSVYRHNDCRAELKRAIQRPARLRSQRRKGIPRGLMRPCCRESMSGASSVWRLGHSEQTG